MIGKPIDELKSIDKSLKYRSVTDIVRPMHEIVLPREETARHSRPCHKSTSTSTCALVNLVAIMFKNSLIQWLCAFDHTGIKVMVRNYEISDRKIRLGRFLSSHKEIKEWLKLQKWPAILPGNLACLHVHGTLRYSTGAELWHYWTTCF